jgi:hypothetical protein
VNGFYDITRPILSAVSTHVLDDVTFYERDVVLEDELCGLDWHVVMLTTLLSF